MMDQAKPAESLVRVSLDGQEDFFPKGMPLLEILKRLLPKRAPQVLCCLCGGLCVELGQPIDRDCCLTSLTYLDEEGRRIYERSLRFLLLLSMRRLYPDKNVRILNSVGYGVYLRLLEAEMTHEMVRALEEDMRNLVAQDLPFEKETWSREKAIRYFESVGWPDKARILAYRPQETITMYRIGELCEYFYGAMLPSTGYIRTFALKPHFPGMVVQFPSPEDPTRPAPYLPRPKHLRVFTQSQRWCNILGADNVADVNELISTGRLREFIRVNEALHDKSIAAIADDIMARQARIVMIFGPSASGKTTFANRLAVHLRVLGQSPQLISLDDFYRDRADIPLERDGLPDLESVDALDIPHLCNCLEWLLAGQKVEMPLFDFKTAARAKESYPLQLTGGQPLLVEGIHGMNDRITSQLPEQLTYGVYVSALPCINLDNHNRIRTTDVRLLRRIVRDIRVRATSPEETIAMWPSVRAGEEKWIFPNQEKADVMFNTSLHYELPILKAKAYDLLLSIPKTAPEYLTARRLIKILHYLLPVGEDVLQEIPPSSILREFIGECSFYDRH